MLERRFWCVALATYVTAAVGAFACRTRAVSRAESPPATGDAAATPAAPSATAAADAEATASIGGAEDAGAVPRGLACLIEHYGGRAVVDAAGAWSLELPDGAVVPWDDGRSKTTAERIASPDLEDMLALRYPRGAIAPVTDVEHDPGRVRVEALFRATYGADARAVARSLVDVKLAGHVVRFHERAAPALSRVAARIDALLRADPSLRRYFRELGGTFHPRNIAGTNRSSAHAWGIAIDIDTSMSDYWRNARGEIVWRNRIPAAIVEAFEAEGFVWGGRWFHYDTMHFEWRPELFDERCVSP